MRNYSDLDNCIESLKSCGATYYTRDIITNYYDGSSEKTGTELVCYSPYMTYDYKKGEPFIHCYVYHWKDEYDIDGKFISHTPFEGLYTSELDYEI